MLNARLFATLGLIVMALGCAKPVDVAHAPSPEVHAQKQGQVNRPPNRKIILPKSDVVLGEKEAPISVVMFVNYFCANCARADRILRDMLEDPELTSQIKLSYRHFPKSSASYKAAKIAEAALLQGEDKFWAMSKRLFAADGIIDEKDYLAWAREIHLDENKFARDLVERENEITTKINQDRNIVSFIRKHGTSTGIFVDGLLFRHDINAHNLKNFIRAVIARKKAEESQAQSKTSPKPVAP